MLDVLLTNANVHTMVEDRPTARAVGVFGDRVVGVDEEVTGLPARAVVDCAGATLTPGFADAHNHMAWFGLALGELDLSGHTDLTALYAAVAARAATLPPDAWVVGSGYDNAALGGHPHRAALDRAAGGRPVWLKHRSGHVCAVSSAVLDRAGVLDGSARVPDGGVVVRDEHAAPTGVLEEQAQRLVLDLVVPYPVDELAAAIARAARVYVAEGLTHVTEAGIGGGWIGHSPVEALAYQVARQRGDLPLRVELMTVSDALHPLPGHPADDAGIGLDLGLRTGFGDDWLRLGPVKVFVDGALTSRTAAVTEPFLDHGRTRGYFQDDPDRLRELVVAAHLGGWRVAAHAIGDRAVDLVLTAVEQAQRLRPRPDARHRVEHAAVVRPDQLARMAALGVIPVPQARFLHEIGDTMAEALGVRRTGWLYRHKSFVDAGIPVPGSSDRPVALGAPLLGMRSMVERTSSTGAVLGPAERVTAAEALRAYTTHAAHAAHQEHRRGRIARGYLADLVLLADDPVTVPSARIDAIEVLATLVGGACAHGGDRLAELTTRGAVPAR